jgi:hypothetical protein
VICKCNYRNCGTPPGTVHSNSTSFTFSSSESNADKSTAVHISRGMKQTAQCNREQCCMHHLTITQQLNDSLMRSCEPPRAALAAGSSSSSLSSLGSSRFLRLLEDAPVAAGGPCLLRRLRSNALTSAALLAVSAVALSAAFCASASEGWEGTEKLSGHHLNAFLYAHVRTVTSGETLT